MILSHKIGHILDSLTCKYMYLYITFEIIDYTAGSPAMTIHEKQGCRFSVAVGPVLENGNISSYYNSVYRFPDFQI